jgi:hypothetical protein
MHFVKGVNRDTPRCDHLRDDDFEVVTCESRLRASAGGLWSARTVL